ncbi:unnamed protein product [Rotaria socialis]|uniref:Uncharacterized protein n=2 Tax=Rotaria socialis TaxID=392032 RepID=A0A820TU50_9BILA|nr:unnamed protein product [Rotaria socialis]CAF4231713.1 unnamed protein product [Rotaria socialis]CAF4476653.1 unnamed protein product [Rotaria socialis]
MSSLQMVTPALLLRAIIEYLPSIMTILLNTVFIVAIIRLRNLRTRQNIFLINSCHGIMYSYLLLSINRFMDAFYRSQKHHLSIKCIVLEIILQWFLAFLIPSIPFCLDEIKLQIKPRFCSARKPLYVILRMRQNYKNEKLLRQCAAFSCVFAIGWGLFACISVFDFNDIVPESIYLITLSFLSISLLVITLMIIHWNKLSSQRINIYFIAHKI